MATFYSLSSCAFSKVILHAAKYPHCSINGVLLAQKDAGDAKSLNLVECIPLFHLGLTLSPMMEVALTQIDAYCKSKGYVIGGYYQANEHLDDAQPTPIGVKIAERIQEQFKQACLVMLDNQQLSSDCSPDCFQVYSQQDGKWKICTDVGVEEDCQSITASLMNSKAYQNLVDFDNHLDDISKDWCNPQINDFIEHTS